MKAPIYQTISYTHPNIHQRRQNNPKAYLLTPSSLLVELPTPKPPS